MSINFTMKLMAENSEVRELYPLDLSETLSLSKFQALSPEEQLSVRVPIVIDNAKWVASDRPLNSPTDIESANILSSDGVMVAKQIRKRKFNIRNVVQDPVTKAIQLVAHSYNGQLYPQGKIKKQKQSEELKEMSNVQNGLDQLKGLSGLSGGGLADIESQLDSGAATSMTAFDQSDATAAANDTAKQHGLRAELSAQVEKLETAEAYPLQQFNFTNGFLVGFVTATDKRVEAVATSEPRMENGKSLISASAPADVQAAFAAGDQVAKKHLQREFRLHFRQAKPGKINALIVAIPQGGLVDLGEFLKPGQLKANEENTTLIYKILGQELYPTFLDFYFGSRIRELPETHGGPEAAGVIEQKATVRYVTKGGNVEQQQRISRLLKNSKGRAVIIDTNYIPLKTYETISLNKALTEQEIETLNLSAFSTLVNGRVFDDGKNKFQLLATEDAARVRVNSEGVISSSYFLANVNDREPLEVRPFYDKEGEVISDIEIPVKEKRFNKDGVPTNPRAKQILTTDEKVLLGAELRKKTSLYSGRFDTIIKASQGQLTVENLRVLTKRTSGKAKTNNSMSNEQLIKLRLGLAKHQIEESDVTFSEAGASDFKALENQITDIRMAAKKA